MFVFKNKSSVDMGVIIEEEEHFLTRASQRYLKKEIEGKNGAIFEEQGYAVVERPMKVQILNTNKLDEILAWLDGVGMLEYNNRITKARFYNEVSPIRTANIKIADITFIRDPFWNKKNDEYVVVENTVENEGTVYSEPIIRIEKNTSNSVDITVNDVRFKYNFNNEAYVEIDCENILVEFNKLNRNKQIEIGYKYPTLNVGENQIIVHEGDATIKIKRKDRWL